MTDFVRTYIEGMGYDPKQRFEDLQIPCEVCGRTATDVHHLHARGMGGTTREYELKDLMGLCRICHEEHGDIKHVRFLLEVIHMLRIQERTMIRVLSI
jgi:5-methylcytosine-specific restriction endonuclease McrA